MSTTKKKKSTGGHQKELVLQNIQPLTFSQRRAFKAFSSDHNILMYGTAGTGKTFLALYFAMVDVYRRKIRDKCLIFRSAVASRNMGFLPGSARDKMKVYEEPYQHIMSDLFDRSGAYALLKQKGHLQFMSTSFLRGATLDDAVIVIDEFQNMSMHEVHTLLTRVGDNCRVIVCGDTKQSDLVKEESFGGKLIDIASDMASFSTIEFFKEDILRSGFVREFLESYERMCDAGNRRSPVRLA